MEKISTNGRKINRDQLQVGKLYKFLESNQGEPGLYDMGPRGIDYSANIITKNGTYKTYFNEQDKFKELK